QWRYLHQDTDGNDPWCGACRAVFSSTQCGRIYRWPVHPWVVSLSRVMGAKARLFFRRFRGGSHVTGTRLDSGFVARIEARWPTDNETASEREASHAPTE